MIAEDRVHGGEDGAGLMRRLTSGWLGRIRDLARLAQGILGIAVVLLIVHPVEWLLERRGTAPTDRVTQPFPDGIEWFTTADGEDCQCARCGSSCAFVRCWNGCEDGYITDLYELDPLWYDPEDIELCSECRGRGGWWHCLAEPAWCAAHPLPGRDAVESTAMNPESWRDAE